MEVSFNNASLIYVFTRGKEEGNPSLVLSNLGLCCPELGIYCLAKAKSYNCTVTHIACSSQDTAPVLRFFVPDKEINFCGHGSLAAAAWMYQKNQACKKLSFQHQTGEIVTQVLENGDQFGFYENAGYIKKIPLNQNIINKLRLTLGLSNLSLKDCQAAIGGNQRIKFLLQMNNKNIMQNLQINANKRDSFCQEFGVTGLYVYYLESQSIIYSRHFPVGSDNEDIATGGIAATVAHWAQTSLVKRPITVYQGGNQCDKAKIMLDPMKDDTWLVSGKVRFFN